MTVCPEGRVSVTWARKNRLENRLEPMLTTLVSGSWFGSAAKRQAWGMRIPGTTGVRPQAGAERPGDFLARQV